MAYTKTQWVNNTTPINDTNLNKIEQGIYDNSLVTEAIADKLNPTDTETYKIAELTEGQITDVIGVNDIIIKGDTSQNGEPTPSSPVDVNVVSGSNVINTSTKNLFDKNSNAITVGYIGANGNFVYDENLSYLNKFIKVNPNTKYTISSERNDVYRIAEYDLNKEFITRKYNEGQSKKYTITTSNNTYYIKMAGTSTATLNSLQLEQGSTATTYEPHQGKELPLDLPVENLFDGGFQQGTLRLNGAGDEATSNTRIRTGYVSVIPNTTYTISNNNSNIYQFGVGLYKSDNSYDSNHKIESGGWINFPYTFTTQSDTYYLRMVFKNSTDTSLSPTGDYEIMVENNVKANAYTPYGTDPIELCKIGNYQDYFYRDNNKGKWYLHKEVGKYTLDGTNNAIIGKSGTTNNNLFISSVISDILIPTNNNESINVYCSHFIGGKSANYLFLNNTLGIAVRTTKDLSIGVTLENTNNTIALINTWLASNNVITYYPLATATDTEITGTLKEQLEAIYNAPLYEETNITQENNDLPMVLDITACKDNINGIKAFIRK